jgi:hypothetical protein
MKLNQKRKNDAAVGSAAAFRSALLFSIPAVLISGLIIAANHGDAGKKAIMKARHYADTEKVSR